MTGRGAKVLVTGGRGQLGHALEERLRSSGEVVALGRDELDVTDRRAVADRVQSEEPTVVIHAAAMTDVDGCERDAAAAYRVNALGSRHVAEAAQTAGARLVAVSTDFVFDGSDARPYHEQSRPEPLSVYGESKLAGEQAVLQAAPAAMIVRTAWLYGPGGGNFVDTILKAGESGRPLKVVADQAGSPTWAPDLADGIARALDAGLSGVIHLVNAGHATRYELARRALDLAGLESVAVEPVTTPEMPRPAARPPHAVLQSRILPAAGLEPLRHWEEALAEHVSTRAAGGSGG